MISFSKQEARTRDQVFDVSAALSHVANSGGFVLHGKRELATHSTRLFLCSVSTDHRFNCQVLRLSAYIRFRRVGPLFHVSGGLSYPYVNVTSVFDHPSNSIPRNFTNLLEGGYK